MRSLEGLGGLFSAFPHEPHNFYWPPIGQNLSHVRQKSSKGPSKLHQFSLHAALVPTLHCSVDLCLRLSPKDYVPRVPLYLVASTHARHLIASETCTDRTSPSCTFALWRTPKTNELRWGRWLIQGDTVKNKMRTVIREAACDTCRKQMRRPTVRH